MIVCLLTSLSQQRYAQSRLDDQSLVSTTGAIICFTSSHHCIYCQFQCQFYIAIYYTCDILLKHFNKDFEHNAVVYLLPVHVTVITNAWVLYIHSFVKNCQ
jgi:hypothetical protein